MSQAAYRQDPLNLTDYFRAPNARMLLALELLLLLVVATQGARLIWIVAAPKAPAAAPVAIQKTRADPGVLASFDAFGVSGGVSAVSGGQGAGEFRLFGVRAGGGGASAIIAGPDGVQKAFAVGEQVAEGVILASVAADHVELSRNGARSTLSFPEIQ